MKLEPKAALFVPDESCKFQLNTATELDIEYKCTMVLCPAMLCTQMNSWDRCCPTLEPCMCTHCWGSRSEAPRPRRYPDSNSVMSAAWATGVHCRATNALLCGWRILVHSMLLHTAMLQNASPRTLRKWRHVNINGFIAQLSRLHRGFLLHACHRVLLHSESLENHWSLCTSE